MIAQSLSLRNMVFVKMRLVIMLAFRLHSSETLAAGAQTSSMVSVSPILPSVQRNVFTIALWILLLWRGRGWRVGSMDGGVGDG